jgi:hypothetical protein
MPSRNPLRCVSMGLPLKKRYLKIGAMPAVATAS